MALTPDVLKSNEVLSTLSEDQLSAITSLSVNDEKSIISTKIGEHHGLIERDVKEVSGIEKNQGEKSYEYMKRVLKSYKESSGNSSELQTKISDQEAKIQQLEKSISDGSTDTVTIQKLKDAEGKLSQLQNQYDTDKNTWETEKNSFTEKITGIQVNSEFNKATAGLKFKAGYPESVQKTLLNSTKDSILSKYKPDWVEADGSKVMVFRDDKGEIVRNRANGLNPYTASELIMDSLKEVVDSGKNTTGAGTGNTSKSDDSVGSADISGAKTQVEADQLIVKHLLQIGETRGSASFAEKQRKIRDQNNISKLPIR